jgi:hypothetical protein
MYLILYISSSIVNTCLELDIIKKTSGLCHFLDSWQDNDVFNILVQGILFRKTLYAFSDQGFLFVSFSLIEACFIKV